MTDCQLSTDIYLALQVCTNTEKGFYTECVVVYAGLVVLKASVSKVSYKIYMNQMLKKVLQISFASQLLSEWRLRRRQQAHSIPNHRRGLPRHREGGRRTCAVSFIKSPPPTPVAPPTITPFLKLKASVLTNLSKCNIGPL